MTAISLNCWSESDQKAIREQLDRILNSGPFHQSQRRQRFLEYLVNEALAGRGERLKGYNVALEVFDRPETFDPNIDPLVRIEAGRLRDKLREYYEGDGQGDPIRIELPKGTYMPHIEFRQAATAASPRPAERRNFRSTLGSLAGLCCIPAPCSQDSLRSPSGLNNCSLACAACRFQRLEVVGSIHSIIRESVHRGLAVRKHWERS